MQVIFIDTPERRVLVVVINDVLVGNHGPMGCLLGVICSTNQLTY